MTEEQKVRHRENVRKWRALDPEKARASSRIWKRTHLLKDPDATKKYRLKKRYGITLDEFNTMVNKQGGRCAICDHSTKDLIVDHCHTTKAIRGLLCLGCNLAIGRVKDNPTVLRAAAVYLEAANVSY